jgi:hypothetical protein
VTTPFSRSRTRAASHCAGVGQPGRYVYLVAAIHALLVGEVEKLDIHPDSQPQPAAPGRVNKTWASTTERSDVFLSLMSRELLLLSGRGGGL